MQSFCFTEASPYDTGRRADVESEEFATWVVTAVRMVAGYSSKSRLSDLLLISCTGVFLIIKIIKSRGKEKLRLLFCCHLVS